jgi:hypothetical protein
MPAVSSRGKCSNATLTLGAIRSRSFGSKSWPKSHGVVFGDQGTPARSYVPSSRPCRSWRM